MRECDLLDAAMINAASVHLEGESFCRRYFIRM